MTERDRSDRRQGDPRCLWKRRHPCCPGEVPQQVLVSLHRFRSGWIAPRTAQINTLRGPLRELGLVSPVERDTTSPPRNCTRKSRDGETGRTGREKPRTTVASEAAVFDWLPLRAFHHGPGSLTPPDEAQDTFAVPTYPPSRARRGAGADPASALQRRTEGPMG